MGKSGAKSKGVTETLRAAALAYPGAWEDFPWGESVVKVGKKVFVFMGRDASGSIGLSAKLPETFHAALGEPFAAPTGYGLGKSGWVTAKFTDEKDVPVPLMLQWIDESYRAIAPKTLVKQLDAARAAARTSR